MKLSSLLVAGLAASVAAEVVPTRHRHHRHRRDLPKYETETTSSTKTSSTSSKGSKTTSTSSSSSSGMPAMTTTSSSETTSSEPSSSSTTYSYHQTVPTAKSNPYISNSTLPTNSVFIVLAALLGAVALGVALTWLIVWWKSRRRAMRDKEVEYYNPFFVNGSGAHFFGDHSPEIFEKSSFSSNSALTDSTRSLNWESSTPGRSYREMSNAEKSYRDMSNAMGRRNSMSISPVLEMMRASSSNLELPLFNPQSEISSSQVSATADFQNGSADSPKLSASHRLSASNLATHNLSQESQNEPKRKSRPPSQLLDEMLQGMEYLSQYPGEK